MSNFYLQTTNNQELKDFVFHFDKFLLELKTLIKNNRIPIDRNHKTKPIECWYVDFILLFKKHITKYLVILDLNKKINMDVLNDIFELLGIYIKGFSSLSPPHVDSLSLPHMDIMNS